VLSRRLPIKQTEGDIRRAVDTRAAKGIASSLNPRSAAVSTRHGENSIRQWCTLRFRRDRRSGRDFAARPAPKYCPAAPLHAADAFHSLRGLRREGRILNRRLLTLGQIIMHDFANSERHIGDEMRAREHIQDRKFRDIAQRMGK